MQRTSSVFARVEPEIKEQAEQILIQLGIPMSNAIGMFLRQIIMQRGIPFAMRLPANEPVAFGAMTLAQINTELEKGYADVIAGRIHDIDDVVAEIENDYRV